MSASDVDQLVIVLHGPDNFICDDRLGCLLVYSLLKPRTRVEVCDKFVSGSGFISDISMH